MIGDMITNCVYFCVDVLVYSGDKHLWRWSRNVGRWIERQPGRIWHSQPPFQPIRRKGSQLRTKQPLPEYHSHARLPQLFF